jgi:hypothetical protein
MTELPKKDTDKEYIRLGLRIVGDFGATLAVPVVAFVLIGQWLDQKYNHTYLFTALAFVLAAVVSAKMIHKKAKQYDKLYHDIEKK